MSQIACIERNITHMTCPVCSAKLNEFHSADCTRAAAEAVAGDSKGMKQAKQPAPGVHLTADHDGPIIGKLMTAPVQLNAIEIRALMRSTMESLTHHVTKFGTAVSAQTIGDTARRMAHWADQLAKVESDRMEAGSYPPLGR